MIPKPPTRFGFAALKDVKPKTEPVDRVAATEEADKSTERHGFTSREPVVLRRRARVDEQVSQFNMRGGTLDINFFIEECEAKRFSYREGFAELIRVYKAHLKRIEEGRE